ncbi:cytidine deaminase [soil metagenome]
MRLATVPRVSVDVTDPEDTKLLVLARSSRARTGASEGAAVRDLDGRTYTAATVLLPSLQVTALALATAMAVSSGASGLAAAAVVTDAGSAAAADLAAVADLAGSGVPVWIGNRSGTAVGLART